MWFKNKKDPPVYGCSILDQGWVLKRSQTSNNTVSSWKHIDVKQTGVFGSKERRYH